MISFLGTQSQFLRILDPFLSFIPEIKDGKILFTGSFIKINEGVGEVFIKDQTLDLEDEYYLNLELSPLGSIDSIKVVPLSKYDDHQDLDPALNLMIPFMAYKNKSLIFSTFYQSANFYRQLPSGQYGIPFFKDKEGFHVFFVEKTERGLQEVSQRNFIYHVDGLFPPSIKRLYSNSGGVAQYTTTIDVRVNRGGQSVYNSDTQELVRPIGLLYEGNRVLPFLNYSSLEIGVELPPIDKSVGQRIAFYTDVYGSDKAVWPNNWKTKNIFIGEAAL